MVSIMNSSLHYAPTPDNPYAWDLQPEELHELLPYEKIYLDYIRKGISIILQCSGVVSFLFFYLVMFQTKGELKRYRPMFILCSSTDVMFYIASFFTEMKCRAADGVFLFTFEGPLRFAPWKIQILGMAIYCTILTLSIAILPAQYSYRYYTMTKGHGMPRLRTTLLFASAYFISIPMGILAYFAYGYSATIRPDFNYGTLWYPEQPLPTVIYADTRHPSIITYFGVGFILVSVCYQVVLYIGYKSITAFKEDIKRLSKKAKNVHNQLTYFLVIQSIIPLFVSSGPNIFIITVTFFRLDPGILMTMISDLMALIPVCNPVLSIIVIKPYRRAVLRFLGKKDLPPTNITSLTASSR